MMFVSGRAIFGLDRLTKTTILLIMKLHSQSTHAKYSLKVPDLYLVTSKHGGQISPYRRNWNSLSHLTP